MLWIGVVVVLITLGAIKNKTAMGVEWRPVLVGMNWIELVWLVILVFSVINILLFISHGGRDAFALINTTIGGDVGARVGIGFFLLILSASQVFRFYKETTNVLAHGFLLLATAGAISMPSINTDATVAGLQNQIAEMRNSMNMAKPSIQKASVSNQHLSNPTDSNNEYQGVRKFTVNSATFYNPILSRRLNDDEVVWCKQKALVGAKYEEAISCGYMIK
jgi:hypothetical protein